MVVLLVFSFKVVFFLMIIREFLVDESGFDVYVRRLSVFRLGRKKIKKIFLVNERNRGRYFIFEGVWRYKVFSYWLIIGIEKKCFYCGF